MDMKQRAELVRFYRAESKQAQNAAQNDPDRFYNPDSTVMHSRRRRVTFTNRHTTSRARADVNRNADRALRVRRGEGADAYIRRTNDVYGGGDISFAQSARTYDLRRPRGSRPAPQWRSDYAYGYNNDSRDSRTVRPPRRTNSRAPALPGRNR